MWGVYSLYDLLIYVGSLLTVRSSYLCGESTHCTIFLFMWGVYSLYDLLIYVGSLLTVRSSYLCGESTHCTMYSVLITLLILSSHSLFLFLYFVFCDTDFSLCKMSISANPILYLALNHHLLQHIKLRMTQRSLKIMIRSGSVELRTYSSHCLSKTSTGRS